MWLNHDAQGQSSSGTGAVNQLSYQARGPFQIKEVLGINSYSVQQYNDNTSIIRKCKGTEINLLQQSLFPHEPLDTIDRQHLNFAHTPMVSPLKYPLQIEL